MTVLGLNILVDSVAAPSEKHLHQSCETVYQALLRELRDSRGQRKG